MFNFLEFLKEQTLFGSVYTDSELSAWLQKFPPSRVEAGRILQVEGAVNDSLFIPMNVSVDLFSRSGDSEIRVERLEQQRMIGLSSILSGKPETATARSVDVGYVFEFPAAIIRSFFDSHPVLKSYATKLLDSAEVARLAEDLRETGCSRQFSAAIISRVEEEQLPAGRWLSNDNQVPYFAFMLLHGDVKGYRVSQEGTSDWLVPHRRWLLWDEILNARSSSVSYRTLSKCTILKLKAPALMSLAQEFPVDCKKYIDNAVNGIPEVTSSDEGHNYDVEVDELEELFAGTLPNPKKLLKSYPWVHQHDTTDCGPACLAMISQFHGRNISIQRWRANLATDREGTSLFDLARCSEKFGFVSHGLFVVDVETLDEAFLPCIVLLNSHYVVLYEVNKKTITIGDPALGIVQVDKKEFYKGFERVGLFLRPTPAFLENTPSERRYSHYLTLFHGFKLEFGLAVACAALFVVVSLFPPILNQFIFDEILGKKDLGLLWIALTAGLVVALADGFITWARTYYTEYIVSKFDFQTKSAVMTKIMSLPFEFFAVRHVGDFSRRMAELEKARMFVTNTLFELSMSFLTIVIYVSVLLLYDVKLALIVLALVPGFFIVSGLFSRKLANLYSLIFADASKADGLFTDLIKGIGAIKATRAELAARWRFEESLVKTIRNRYDFTLASSALNGMTHGYYQFTKLVVLGYCAFLAVHGELSIGQVVALTMISSQVLIPFATITTYWPQVQEVKAALDRLNDILLAPSEKIQSLGLRPEKLLGDIEFRDVWFRYGGEASEWVLKGTSFKIEAGKSVAIVGPSGSGKSTVAYLLARLYEPTQGQIFVDGRDYRDYDIDWLRSQIGLLLQESQLFHGSILENIGFNTADPDEEKATDAAAFASADQFIRKKPRGYEYTLSHGGFGLSGGEKQRIALARVIYNDPAVLVLDEATSALDGINETVFLENLKKRRENATTISIAHRFSTVSASQLVLILSNGNVVGYGTHEDLKKNNQLYKSMFGFSSDGPSPKNPSSVSLEVVSR